jgi:PAS domain S-box-containing protein
MRSPRFWIWATIGLAVWTAAIVAAFWLDARAREAATIEIAQSEARVAWRKDVAWRAMVAKLGGVYAEVTTLTPPNQYLKADERDITTPRGKSLTLLNPSYLTRLVHASEMASQQVVGHITSLRPIRPANMPDSWERGALKRLERGEAEVAQVAPLFGQPYMRVMHPLRIEPSCMPCHEEQGYKVGDLRGGISGSVPMQPLYDAQRREETSHAAALGTIWVLGMVGVVFSTRLLSKRSAALSRSEQRFRGLAEGAQDLIYLYHPGPPPVLEYVNDVIEEITGYSREELMADPEMLLRIVHPDERDRMEAILAGESSPGRPEALRVIAKDGTVVPLEHRVTYVREVSGVLRTVEGIARDITARRRLEQLKADWASLISHELKNPLTAILGFAELVEKGGLADDPEQCRNAAGRIRVRAHDMDRMITDMLTVANLETSTLQLIPRETDLEELARWRAEAAPVTDKHMIVVDVQEGLPHPKLDRDRLGYAISNLLSNAVKYSPDGGEVRLSVTADADEVRIAVSDKGRGIEPADMDKIFERFDRGASGGMAGGPAGHGLGLFVAKGIVEAHGGRLEVRSEPGKGSTFTIVLPASGV